MLKSNDPIGNRTYDFPICSAVPQPTAPPRIPTSESTNVKVQKVYMGSNIARGIQCKHRTAATVYHRNVVCSKHTVVNTLTIIAAPRLITGLSPRSTRFRSSPGHVGAWVTKAALEQVFLRKRAPFCFPLSVSFHQYSAFIHSIITDTILFYKTMTSLNNPLQNKTTTKQYKTNISGAILEVYILLTTV